MLLLLCLMLRLVPPVVWIFVVLFIWDCSLKQDPILNEYFFIIRSGLVAMLDNLLQFGNGVEARFHRYCADVYALLAWIVDELRLWGVGFTSDSGMIKRVNLALRWHSAILPSIKVVFCGLACVVYGVFI